MKEDKPYYDQGEFNYIRKKISQYGTNFKLNDKNNGFYYFVLDEFFDINEGEFNEVITDTHFNKSEKLSPGGDSDCGIDIFFIEGEGEEKPTINILTLKLKREFEQAKDYFFENSEVEKVLNTIMRIKGADKNILLEGLTENLLEKIQTVFDLFSKGKTPQFKLWIVSNSYKGLEENKKKSISNRLKNLNIELGEIFMEQMINITLKQAKDIDGKIMIYDKKKFLHNEGNSSIGCVIFPIKTGDLLRLVCDNEGKRNDVNESMAEEAIEEDVFEDNVRIFKKIKGKKEEISYENDINKNIELTAHDEKESDLFFYYNNGITIICDHYEYDSSNHKFIIEIKNLQIVNGQQTIYSLHSAYKTNKEIVSDVEVLIKLYKTKDKDIKTKIAGFTNSQNPVTSRDIRSVDLIQVRLEDELKDKGFYYERKKNQFENMEKDKRLNSELIGQILFSYNCGQPTQAKNNRKIIFGSEYKNIFNENINAESILSVWDMYGFILGQGKSKIEENNLEFANDQERLHLYSYYKYTNFFFLFVMKKISDFEQNKLEKNNSIPRDDYERLYNKADELIFKMIENIFYNKEEKKIKISSSFASFFKNLSSIQEFDKVFEEYKTQNLPVRK